MNNNSEILVEVKGVSKKFSRSLRSSMLYGLKDLGKAMLGINSHSAELRNEEFWAVKDVSFTLRRGECIGLIGHNGAGKSTLLKMLNGLIRPDEGSITMRGKVGALIELGAGFNPLLTGRENVYINGQLLGFSRKEIEDKFQAILDFAEIGEFIDSPVQNYSSGMKVRLGFAVASQMEPDILLIDEVLAVGDLGFVLKCFNVMDSLLEKTAVVFVSHSMPQVSRICSSIILMDKGRTIFQNIEVAKGIDLYYSKFSLNNKILFKRNDDAELLEINLGDQKDNNSTDLNTLNHLSDLHVNFKIKIKSEIYNPFILITIYDKEQRAIGVCQTQNGLNENYVVKKEKAFTFYDVKLTMPRINLSQGLYSISLSVFEKLNSKPMLRLQKVIEFKVFAKHQVWPSIEFEGIWL